MSAVITTITESVIAGRPAEVVAGVQAALAADLPLETILQQGLIAGMAVVGQKFECGDFFVPDMLRAARAMQAGLELLKPRLQQADVPPAGRVLIGTVQGDLHEIGKNLVAMVLSGAGYAVKDLGVDVPPERFVEAVRAEQPDVLALSALLSTTIPGMQRTIKAVQAAGLRDRVKIIVGGAPVTAEYAQRLGADGYAADASQSVALVGGLLRRG
ncbi:MAG: corrinoid protein [Anaerolineales bacterium]|nr:corrinoid protein [Anaerolineales bacterium]